MQQQVYTFGYSNSATHGPMGELLADKQTILIDLRLSPRSRWQPAWNKDRLASLWGGQYLFLGYWLGNTNYQDRSLPIQFANSEKGLETLETMLQQGRIPVLFCACRDYKTCHRRVVVELLMERIPGLVHQELGGE